jgi:acetolactate decarboxylase
MLKIIYTTLFIFTTLIFNGCSWTIWNKEVKHAGALKNAMKKGDLTPKIELKSLKDKKNLYALGAVGYLKGEVQIFDSKPMTTFVDKSNKLQYDHTYGKNASLLVYAQVKDWVEYKIPNDIRSREQFEEYIEEKAEEHGLDTEEPFVFLIDGTIRSNSWHVINWNPNDKVHSHQKHVESGIHNTMKDTPILMLGFFSMYHSGIYTHHTTSMHIHFMTKDKKISGHSDNMILGSNMILKLPKIKY